MRTTKLKNILDVRLAHHTGERRVHRGGVKAHTVASAQPSASSSSSRGTSPPIPNSLRRRARRERTGGSRERRTMLRGNGRGVVGRGGVLNFGVGALEAFLELREFLPVSPGLEFFVTSIHVPKRRFS
nr:hypothetical protein Itr_chr13CG03770 [Ipomoea trifida]